MTVMSPSSGPQTTLNPYLELPHLLSLTWLAYPVLSIGFIVFRLIQSEISSQVALNSAKGNLLASCRAAEQASTGVASMPRYMAAATNRQIQDAVNSTVNGARSTLLLAFTIIEVIINFVIDIYRSTLLCFVEFAVRSLLSSLIALTGEYNKFVQDTAAPLATKLQQDINSFSSTIQNAVNKLPSFARFDVPQITAPDLGALVNIQLHSGLQDNLVQLNASIPTVADLKNAVEDIVDTPFELLKKEVNETLNGLSFNINAISIPGQNLVTFCDNVDVSVVDDLKRDLHKATLIGIIALLICAALLILGNCVIQWWRWRSVKANLERVRTLWIAHPQPTDRNLMRVRAQFAHPFLIRLADKIVSMLGLSPRAQIHLYWFFAYIFHGPALVCFLIGVFGILSVQLQLFLIGPLAAQYGKRVGAAVKDFSTLIASSINDSMRNQSAAYANDVNGRIDVMQRTVNDGLFSWVNGTTSVINSTVSNFYAEVQDVVNKVFGNTPLATPAQTLVRCLIGSKVVAIQDAAKFLHDNLRVDMPRMSNDVLLLSNASVDEMSNAVATAATGGNASGDEPPLMTRIIDHYVDALHKERLFFAIFAGLWFVVVLMGICVILKHTCCGGRVKEEEEEEFVMPIEKVPSIEKAFSQPKRAPSPPLPREPRDPWFTGFELSNPFKRVAMPRWQMPERMPAPIKIRLPKRRKAEEEEAEEGWEGEEGGPSWASRLASVKMPTVTMPPVTMPTVKMPTVKVPTVKVPTVNMPSAPTIPFHMQIPSMPSLPSPPRRQRKERPESMLPLLEETRANDNDNNRVKAAPAVPPKEPRRLTPGKAEDPNPFFTPFDDEHAVPPNKQGPIAF